MCIMSDAGETIMTLWIRAATVFTLGIPSIELIIVRHDGKLIAFLSLNDDARPPVVVPDVLKAEREGTPLCHEGSPFLFGPLRQKTPASITNKISDTFCCSREQRLSNQWSFHGVHRTVTQ